MLAPQIASNILYYIYHIYIYCKTGYVNEQENLTHLMNRAASLKFLLTVSLVLWNSFLNSGFSPTQKALVIFMYLLLTGLDLTENVSRSIHHTSPAGQTISPAHLMYCVRIIDDDAHLTLPVLQ